MGLVGQVVPHDELDAATATVLGQIAATGPAARAAVKRDLNSRLPVPDVALFFHAMRSPEIREGMAAFVEKRPPAWPRP